jgi:hypothetical protein
VNVSLPARTLAGTAFVMAALVRSRRAKSDGLTVEDSAADGRPAYSDAPG